MQLFNLNFRKIYLFVGFLEHIYKLLYFVSIFA